VLPGFCSRLRRGPKIGAFTNALNRFAPRFQHRGGRHHHQAGSAVLDQILPALTGYELCKAFLGGSLVGNCNCSSKLHLSHASKSAAQWYPRSNRAIIKSMYGKPRAARDVSRPLSDNKHLLRWVGKWSNLPSREHSNGWMDSKKRMIRSAPKMVEGGTFYQAQRKTLAGCLLRPLRTPAMSPASRIALICSLSQTNPTRTTNKRGQSVEMRKKMKELFQRLHARPHDVRPTLQHGSPLDRRCRRSASSDGLSVCSGKHARSWRASACRFTPRSPRARPAWSGLPQRGDALDPE